MELADEALQERKVASHPLLPFSSDSQKLPTSSPTSTLRRNHLSCVSAKSLSAAQSHHALSASWPMLPALN